MKYIKTYESYEVPASDLNPTNEIFGLSKTEQLEKKKAKLEADFNQKKIVWSKKGAINKVTPEVSAKFMEDASKDGYEGVVAIDKDKNIYYKPSKDVSWSAPGGHSFGAGK
jgi:hypothetical protein